MTDQFTPAWLEERFEQAVRTLRRLPNPRGTTPRGYASSWPDYANDPGQSYGCQALAADWDPNGLCSADRMAALGCGADYHL